METESKHHHHHHHHHRRHRSGGGGIWGNRSLDVVQDKKSRVQSYRRVVMILPGVFFVLGLFLWLFPKSLDEQQGVSVYENLSNCGLHFVLGGGGILFFFMVVEWFRKWKKYREKRKLEKLQYKHEHRHHHHHHHHHHGDEGDEGDEGAEA